VRWGAALRRRLREIAKNAALVVASLLAAAVCLEIGVRLFTDTPAAVGERDPVIGKRHRRNHQASVFVAEANREVWLRFNREGFRGGDVPEVAEPNVRRVAVLGDSFVVAVANDEEDTLVARLQSMLEESHPSRRWEAQNFGVSGSSTGQQLVLYREVVARYQPDLVLLAYCIGNDFSDNSTELSSSPRIYFEVGPDGALVQVPFSTSRRMASSWLNRHSRFYVWFKRANDILRTRVDDGFWIYNARPDQRLEGIWELNERLILALSQEVQSRGSHFVLVLLPTGAQVYDDTWQRATQQAGRPPNEFDPAYPDQRLVAFGKRHGIPVLAMRNEFRDAAGGRSASSTPASDLLFFAGYGHFTDRGNSLAAGAIHQFLSEGNGREILEQIMAGSRTR
jgi:hypothetical protein